MKHSTSGLVVSAANTCAGGRGKPSLIVSVSKFKTRVHSCQSGSWLLLSALRACSILITRVSLSEPLLFSITSSTLSFNASPVLRIIFIITLFNLLRLSRTIAFSLLFLRLFTKPMILFISFISFSLSLWSFENFAFDDIISSAIIWAVP